MLTSRIIKIVVENVSGINDLSIKSRKRFYCDIRFVYFKLCDMYKSAINESTTSIGKTVNRDHATMLHGVKKFNQLYNTPTFLGSDVYVKCLTELYKLNVDIENVDNIIREYDVKMYYRIQHIKLTEKAHSVISNMQRKIDLLTSNNLVKKLLTLEAQELKEAEERLEVFFKVKEKLREKQKV